MEEGTLSHMLLRDTAFQKLMQNRIHNVLLIATPYDRFIMEEDGRVEEQIYFEYTSLKLSSPPRVAQVSDYGEAMTMLQEKSFDLIIAMPGVDISETFSFAKKVKILFPQIPYVVLTPFSRQVSDRLANEDFTGVDYVFSWLGNVDLLLAIIKLLEDKMNAVGDINEVGVQAILLVEDSVRFYSSVLPTIYRFLLSQSRNFATEALNEHEQMLRMRGRSKVLLARDYEEALALYEKFGENIIGVVSDVSFKRKGVKDSKAGIRLTKELLSRDPYLPIIVESSEIENEAEVLALKQTFLDKNSKKLPVDLGNAISERFGFGDFVVRDPHTGSELFRIHNLQEMQKMLYKIPDESFFYHASYNDVSRWLYSRALFPIAEVTRHHHMKDVSEVPAIKALFTNVIVQYRRMKNRGVVAVFKKGQFDHYSSFARIGEGSLGGKGRGLAFVDSIIKKNPVFDNFQGVSVSIPRTIVLCTDIFDIFMENNNLYPMALSDIPDEEILRHFVAARLPEEIRDDLKSLFEVLNKPLAVRSSSLLEDSHYQPFAGVYTTYMIPHLDDKDEMLRQLTDAIKSVYASVFFAESKAYMQATSNVIDQEKMAVIIQEVAGTTHDGFYYPSFSGVGRSLNYYPINNEQPEDGVVELAVGLGKYIVDGGMALRFSPKWPRNVLQTSTLDLALRDTQRQLYALPITEATKNFSPDDGFNIKTLNVNDAAKNGSMKYLVSTYNANNQMLVDTDQGLGRKVVTFANILNHNVLPLADLTHFMLTKGQEAMGRPVEIEFAVNVSPSATSEPQKGHLYWLQIRPIVDRKEMLDEAVQDPNQPNTLIYSNKALGHGIMDNITSVVMVKNERFGFDNNISIANEVAVINRQFAERGENYILIGPGRWGSSDYALGVPVKWPYISSAKVIVEVSLPGKRIEPSQGSHFFQNLTSFGVGYFTIDTEDEQCRIDLDTLQTIPASHESENLRIVTFPHPLTVAINGRKRTGIVLQNPQ